MMISWGLALSPYASEWEKSFELRLSWVGGLQTKTNSSTKISCNGVFAVHQNIYLQCKRQPTGSLSGEIVTWLQIKVVIGGVDDGIRGLLGDVTRWHFKGELAHLHLIHTEGGGWYLTEGDRPWNTQETKTEGCSFPETQKTSVFFTLLFDVFSQFSVFIKRLLWKKLELLTGGLLGSAGRLHICWSKVISVLDVSPRRLSTELPGKTLTKTMADDVSTADFSNIIHVAFYVCIFFFFLCPILAPITHASRG